MTLYAIGDVQGCHDPLLRLLDAIDFDPQRDRVWFTGDLVNRGPDSLLVLRLVRALGAAAVTVLGNHDLHLLAVAAGVAPVRRRDTLDSVLAASDREELLDWLLRRPLLHHDPEHHATLVHAGLPPQWNTAQAQACAREVESVLRGPDPSAFLERMYGDQPARWSAGLSGTDRLRFTVNCLTRMRYCSADGSIDLAPKGAPGTQPDGLMPWFAVPGRASAGERLVFGHWSTLPAPLTSPDLIALDSGCVWGGALTAQALDPPGARASVACVACSA